MTRMRTKKFKGVFNLIVNKRQLRVFLITTFFITYVLLGIMIIANQFNVLGFDTPFGMLIYILSTLSPTIVSYLVLKKSGLTPNVKQYIKTTINIKQKRTYYGLVIALLLMQYILPAIMQKSNSSNWYMGIIMIIPCILDGGLEELGWRYIVHPTIEKRLSFVSASFITAVIWILWHIPFFFVSGTSQSEIQFVTFSIMLLGNSFALSAIYHVTKSAWLCILYHGTLNAFSFYWPLGRDMLVTIIISVLMVLFSTAIVYFYDRYKSNKKAK